jgi:primosomal protein N'
MAGLNKEQKALKSKAIELSGVSSQEFAKLTSEQQAEHMTKAQEAIDAATEEAKLLAAEQATAAAAAKEQAKPKDDHLVKMAKGEDLLSVHPSCVADHKRLGWTEV